VKDVGAGADEKRLNIKFSRGNKIIVSANDLLGALFIAAVYKLHPSNSTAAVILLPPLPFLLVILQLQLQLYNSDTILTVLQGLIVYR